MPTSIKALIGAIFLAMIAATVIYFVNVPEDSASSVPGVIESVSPADGDKTLQNGQITVDLLTGWDGRLTVDQRPIPDDELIKVREQGIIKFQPGKGKAIEYFPAGQNCVTITYWQVATGEEPSFTKPWCFTAF